MQSTACNTQINDLREDSTLLLNLFNHRVYHVYLVRLGGHGVLHRSRRRVDHAKYVEKSDFHMVDLRIREEVGLLQLLDYRVQQALLRSKETHSAFRRLLDEHFIEYIDERGFVAEVLN